MADVIKVTLVNRVPNSVTVSTGVSGGGTWGTISGTITDQSDLVTYVDDEIAAINLGVTELNGLSGDLDLVAGSNVTITPSGSTITIASTGGGGGGTAESVDLDTVTQSDTTIDFTIDGDAFFYRQSYGYNGTTTPFGRNIFIGKNTGNVNVGSTATQNYLGSDNIGIGDNNLDQLTDGGRNVAIGQGVGGNITTGGSNVMLGWGNGGNITTGSENFLLGNFSGGTISTHKGNVAIGTTAFQLGRGFYNIAIGDRALQCDSNASVGNNIAIGRSSMNSIASGSDANVGIGNQTLQNLGSNADGNIAIGYQTGANGVGNGAAYNILIGYRVEPPISTGDNQLNIGNLIHGTGLTSNQTISTGNIGIATDAPTSKMHLKGTAMEQLRIETSGGPTSNADTSGEIGDIAYDANYIYIKTSNGWGRAALDFSF